MKTTFWVDVKEANKTKTTIAESGAEAEENVCQNFYGRLHNEEVHFTQENFQAYQDILNKRNELLGSVKHTYSI